MEDLRRKTLLFCAILAFAIALSVLMRVRRAVHLLFAAFAAALACWYASQSLTGFFHAPIWIRATGILTVLLPQFAVHLFQNVVDRPVQASRFTRVSTAIGVPMLALVVSPYHEKPFALGLVYTYVIGLLGAALVALWMQGQKTPSRAIRARVRFLVGTGGAATTFTLADFLSYLGVRLPPIGAVLAIVFLFVLAESLTRPRLADIYEMAGRLLVATALAFSLAGIFYLFVEIIGGFDAMYLNAVLAAIVFLVVFEPLQEQVETRIHQFFFRERYDLETSIVDLRKRLAHVLEVEEMIETVLAGLQRSRRATTAAIYLRDQDGDGFDLAGSFGAQPPKRIEALAVRPILSRLEKRGSISLEELARETSKDDPALVTATATLGVLKEAVLLAVRVEEGELVGLVCIADDRVRDAFTPEEVLLLENVAAQIGVTLTTSRVYARMKERDRLAALGSMAAGLAHEVKNPLGAIKGAAQLLEEDSHDGGSREFVGIILEEVNRLDRVVGSFLDYARPHAGNPIPLDINAAVRRTVQILSSQHNEDVQIELDLTETLPRARIDPEKFRQVLMNLVQNAIQAMDGHGRVTVSTAARKGRLAWLSQGAAQAPESRIPSSAREDAELVEVSVRDTGPGIPQKVLRNLFVPFFTTKTEGTGLGLAISQSIVQNAGGTIDVQSQPGAGTTFTILLPAATDALATPMPGETASLTEKAANAH